MSTRIACIFNYAPHYRRTIYELMDRELGCDFYFGANLPGVEPIQKMDVHSLKGFRRESRVFYLRLLWQCGYPWLSLHRYDAFILTGDTRLSNLVLMWICKRLGKKVFLWGHGLRSANQHLRSPFRWFFHAADGHFLYGERGRKVMEEFGIDPGRLHVIYNSLDYDRQLEVRAGLSPSDIYRTRFGNGDPTLLFIGRLTPQKRLSMILHAAAFLRGSATPVNVIFVGSGSEEIALRRMAATLGLAARVWFYGATHNEEEIGKRIYNAAACVSPGEIGLTAMHALAYGCPVVTHDQFEHQGPEYEAVVPGRTGHFFRRDDQGDLNDAIARTLDLTRSGRETVRDECYRVIDEKYNPHRQIEVIKTAIVG